MYKEDQCKFMWVLKFILQLGEYQCKAENDVGEALKTVTVAGRVHHHHHHTDDHHDSTRHFNIWRHDQISAISFPGSAGNPTRKIELLKLDQRFSEHFMLTPTAAAEHLYHLCCFSTISTGIKSIKNIQSSLLAIP